MAEGHLSPPGPRPSKACLPSPALALQEACSALPVPEPGGPGGNRPQSQCFPTASKSLSRAPDLRPASLWCLIQPTVTLGCPLVAHLVGRYFLPTGVDKRESSAQ